MYTSELADYLANLPHDVPILIRDKDGDWVDLGTVEHDITAEYIYLDATR